VLQILRYPGAALRVLQKAVVASPTWSHGVADERPESIPVEPELVRTSVGIGFPDLAAASGRSISFKEFPP